MKMLLFQIAYLPSHYPHTCTFGTPWHQNSATSDSTAKPKARAKRPRPASPADQAGRVNPPLPPPSLIPVASLSTVQSTEISTVAAAEKASRRAAAAESATRGRGGRLESDVVVVGIKRRGTLGMARGAAAAGEAAAATERERRERLRGARGGSTQGVTVVEDQLWPDKHRPRDVSSLAVHSKKVQEIEAV